jgi:uncharacterized protein YjdB
LSNGTAKVVTPLATWQSSSPSIATVSSGGVVSGIGSGNADITATYQNVSGTARVAIVRPLFALNGTVTDGTSGGVLPNIRVEVTDGENAGRFDLTSGAGTYAIAALGRGAMSVTASAVIRPRHSR